MTQFQLFNFDISRELLLNWLIAGATGLITFVVLVWLRRIIQKEHTKMLKTAETELLEVPFGILSRTRILFFVIVAVFLGAKTLKLTTEVHTILNSIITIALFLQAGVWATAAVSMWLSRKRVVHQGTNLAVVSSLGILGFAIQAIIWTIVLLLTLENVGVRVTALVAGLGVGGVAVALAVQNVLGDILASLAITFDRPFVVGDFLCVDNILGGVEYIGVKTTRLRSLDGEQIIISNADLIKSRIHNYGRQTERRVLFSFGVSFETPVELVESLPSMIRDIVKSQPGTRFDRSHFSKYTQSSLEYEVVYFVLSADYNRYMDIQQTINIQLLRKFIELGVQFAHPCTTVYFANDMTNAQGSNKNVNQLRLQSI